MQEKPTFWVEKRKIYMKLQSCGWRLLANAIILFQKPIVQNVYGKKKHNQETRNKGLIKSYGASKGGIIK